MLKMFPRPKRTGSGQGHVIVFIVGGWVPVLVYWGSVGQWRSVPKFFKPGLIECRIAKE